MKLLLLALFGLMAMAVASAQKDPRDYEVLEEKSDPDDIDQSKIALMETEGTPNQYLSGLTRASREHKLSEEVEVQLSPGYKLSLSSMALTMFDHNSAANEEVGANTTISSSNNSSINTTISSSSSSNNSSSINTLSALSHTRKRRQTETSLYFCPHRNFLLHWFPYYLNGNLHVCFLPWANFQAITYANCSNRRCRIRYNRLGRCRPSCFRRRRIIALCIDTVTGQWRWRVIIRNLPQACRCSTC